MLVQSLGWEDPLEGGVKPTPVFLPRESHEQRNLAGYKELAHKESEMTEQLGTAQHNTGDIIWYFSFSF